MSVREARVADDLYDLTERAARAGHDIGGGLLGGEFGYGAWIDNDVFMMHPFCWCEKSDCPWCAPCECGDDAGRHFVGDREVTVDEFYDNGGHSQQGARFERVPEKECANCRRGDERFAPNFLHKPSGTWVRWYKYIGRGMEMDVRGDWRQIIAECEASL